MAFDIRHQRLSHPWALFHGNRKKILHLSLGVILFSTSKTFDYLVSTATTTSLTGRFMHK
jgi:hypothetical protein